MTLPPLLVVDVQVGFMNQYTEGVPAAIRTFCEWNEFEHRIFTRFVNPGNGAWTNALEWDGMRNKPDILLCPEIEDIATSVVKKNTYCPFVNTDLEEKLQATGHTSVLVCGINTDVCVLATATSLHDRGYQPIVLYDLSASTAGLKYHDAGLTILPHHIGRNSVVSSRDWMHSIKDPKAFS